MYWSLPFVERDTWDWTIEPIKNKTIGAGNSKDLFEVTGQPGWFYWGAFSVQGENAQATNLKVVTDNYENGFSLKQLFINGAYDRSSDFPSITRYDTDENLFSLLWEPQPPLPFSDRIKIRLSSPPDNDVVINTSVTYITITDPQRFVRSFQVQNFGMLMEQVDDMTDELRMLREEIRGTRLRDDEENSIVR
jgi:hypothetical protein